MKWIGLVLWKLDGIRYMASRATKQAAQAAGNEHRGLTRDGREEWLDGHVQGG